MPKVRPDRQRYGPGTINTARRGLGFDCFVMVAGKRHRARRRTLTEARQWILATADSAGPNALPLTRCQIADAQNALRLLPQGFTLSDAARLLAGREGPRTTAEAVPLTHAVMRYFDARGPALAERTANAYRTTLARLQRQVGPAAAQDVRPDHIEALVAGLNALARNGVLRTLHAFFAWATRAGIVEANPVANVARARAPEPPRGILQPDQARALLDQADHRLKPHLALGLFAGLRPAEIDRLPPDKIGPEYVTIDGQTAKTAQHRTVQIRPNLRAWLDRYPFRPITPKVKRRLTADAFTRSGAPHPHDALRHSFCTFAFEQSKDALTVGAEAGHSVDVFRRHYRALATPGQGSQYFAIFPPSGTPTGQPRSRKSRSVKHRVPTQNLPPARA